MAVAQEELEQVDADRRSSSTPTAPRRLVGNSGPLQGFNDPATKRFRPLSRRPVELPEGPENQSDANTLTDDQPSDATTAQAFRAGTVDAQRRQQQAESDERVRQYKAIQQGKKTKDIPILAPSSTQDFLEKQYKRGWQIAQEAVEDLVIETFFLLDLVLIPMYFVRWIGGNMMGGLFTISREMPGLPGTTAGQKINIKLIPGYSLADPIDYVRHIKFLLLAVLPLAILGFLIMLVYFWINWANIFDPNIRAIWQGVIKTLPAFSGS